MLVRAILAVDEPKTEEKLRGALKGPDVILNVVRGKGGLWERISRESSDLILISESLIPEPAFETIGTLRNLPGSPLIVIISAHGRSEDEADWLAAGCDASLDGGLPAKALGDALEAMLEKRRESMMMELAARDLSEPHLSDFVSNSSAMQAFMNTVHRVARSDAPLLFQGETGVGKERLARGIHAESPRSEGPFVAVNCGALPDALLESELFGHEEGAFTGASRARRGWFEIAHGGTIFLDEIGDLPLHLQVKLLRVLQDHQIQRVGSEGFITVDVRVMAASNLDLEAEVEEKRFRRDLYYRLGVVTLTVPPLRERREDIPALVDSYINHFRTRIGANVYEISPEALQALSDYDWPGNVRELMNIIERAMLLCDEERITLGDLPQVISRTIAEPAAPWLGTAEDGRCPEECLQRSLREVRQEVVERSERAYLTGLLRETHGRIGDTAKRAGIQPRSLFDKMQRYGLRKEDFR